MHRPDALPDHAVLLRERWGRPSIATWAILTILALVLPGTLALVLRPENPGEGYVALALAAMAFAWQGYRLAVSAVEISPAGVRRLGVRSRVVPWETIQDLHLHTIRPAYGAARPPLHHLRLTTDDGTLQLTRYPIRDREAAGVTETINALGVPLAHPP